MVNRLFTLIIMRHAEAEGHSHRDHGRHLTSRGIDTAKTVGQMLRARASHCDLALSSDATRTLETTKEVLASFPAKNLIQFHELYAVHEVSDFLAIIESNLQETDSLILVVGHNPIISAVISRLTGTRVALSPADFLILKLESDSWKTALMSHGCWIET